MSKGLGDGILIVESIFVILNEVFDATRATTKDLFESLHELKRTVEQGNMRVNEK